MNLIHCYGAMQHVLRLTKNDCQHFCMLFEVSRVDFCINNVYSASGSVPDHWRSLTIMLSCRQISATHQFKCLVNKNPKSNLNVFINQFFHHQYYNFTVNIVPTEFFFLIHEQLCRKLINSLNVMILYLFLLSMGLIPDTKIRICFG